MNTPIHCLICTVNMKKEWQEQVEKGVAEINIMVTKANPAYTMQPTMQQGMPILIPVCVPHLVIPDMSGLIH